MAYARFLKKLKSLSRTEVVHLCSRFGITTFTQIMPLLESSPPVSSMKIPPQSWKSFHCRIFAGTVYIGFAYIPAGPRFSVWSTSTIPGNVVVSAVAVATIEIAMQKYAEIMLQRFVAIMCAPFERTRDLFVGPFFMFLFLCQCFLNAMHWKCMLLGFVGPSWRILCSSGRVYLSFCFVLLFVFKNKSRWPYCVPTGWNKDMVGERNASICIKMGNHCKLGFIDGMHLTEKILLIIWLFQVFLLSDCNFTKSLNIWQLWKNNIWRLG